MNSVGMMCPATSHEVEIYNDDVMKVSDNAKKTRNSTESEMSQSETLNTVTSEKEDIPLDINRLVK